MKEQIIAVNEIEVVEWLMTDLELEGGGFDPILQLRIWKRVFSS
jgi:hypothetical protein